MISATFIFYIFLKFPGNHPPIQKAAPIASLEECVEAVHDVLSNINPEWPSGTQIQAGCVVTPAEKS